MFKQINGKDPSKVLIRFEDYNNNESNNVFNNNEFNNNETDNNETDNNETDNNETYNNKCYLQTNYGINNIPIVVKTTHDYTNNTNLYYSYKLDIQYTELLSRYLENLMNISLSVCNNSLTKCINLKLDILIICVAIIKTSKKARVKLDKNNKNELIIITNKINYYSVIYILLKLDYYILNLQFNKIEINTILITNKNKIKTYIDNKVFDYDDIKKIENESNQIYNDLINNKKIIESFNNTEKNNNYYLIIIIILLLLFFIYYFISF